MNVSCLTPKIVQLYHGERKLRFNDMMVTPS